MSLGLAELRILSAVPVDTHPRTPLISFCTVQLWTLCAAYSLATLFLFTTSGPDPGELLGFLGSMVFHHAPIPQKGLGKQQGTDDTLYTLIQSQMLKMIINTNSTRLFIVKYISEN